MDVHPNVVTTATFHCWTPEEDAKPTSAVTDKCKKKRGKKYRIDCLAIATLVPGRTNIQCRRRWHGTLVSNVDPTSVPASKWTVDDNKKLKDAVLKHGGKNWEKISALVPGRTKGQCFGRRFSILVSKIDPATNRAGKWTADEDKKLKEAVQTHGGKNWGAIAELIPGRTKGQCIGLQNRADDGACGLIGGIL